MTFTLLDGGTGDIRGGAQVVLKGSVFSRTAEVVGLWADDQLLVSVADFASGAGTLRLAVRNLAYTGVVRARFTDIEFSSNVLIDGKFIEDRQVTSGRILGLVPATSLARRGLRDVRVFGTFGAEDLVNGFLYILPEPKTTGHARGEHLVTFIDPQLRDT